MAKTRISVLEMDSKDARRFFLKSESYFNADLPDYINFDGTIQAAKELLTSKKGNPKDISDIADTHTYQERDDLNYTIVMSKGEYSWRPLTLLHPVLYTDLVNYITKKANWNTIVKRFHEFQNNESIKCYSIPVEAIKNSKKKDIGETILNWWEKVEQTSLEMNIKYEYCMYTDIADCYPSIYTHSIAWALHGKTKVKEDPKKGRKFLGGIIDSKISKMQYNQTNGIPQGSVLMDFIAEIVLGYADLKLTEKLKVEGISDYEIIRYRDDYRIFSNDREKLERILKILSEVLFELNFKLNTQKTKLSNNIVIDSIKPAKLYWEEKRSSSRHHFKDSNGENLIAYNINLQKHLLEIKKLADVFPDSGQLSKALNEFHKERIKKSKKRQNDSIALIGIIVDIMIRNPRSISNCVMIIGDLLKKEDNNTVKKVIETIVYRYESKTNTEIVILWLQRLNLLFDNIIELPFRNDLSLKIENSAKNLFPIDWLKQDYQSEFNEGNIVNEEMADMMSNAILVSELDFFDGYIV